MHCGFLCLGTALIVQVENFNMYFKQKPNYTSLNKTNSCKASKKIKSRFIHKESFKKVFSKVASVLIIVQLLVSSLFGYGNYLHNSEGIVSDVLLSFKQQEYRSSQAHHTVLTDELGTDLQKILAALLENGEEKEENLKKKLRCVVITITSLYHFSTYWAEKSISLWLYNWVDPIAHLPRYVRYCALKIPS